MERGDWVVGPRAGANVVRVVGERVGIRVGENVGSVMSPLGLGDGVSSPEPEKVGEEVGLRVGDNVGSVVGNFVSPFELGDGVAPSATVGANVGNNVGISDALRSVVVPSHFPLGVHAWLE